MSRLNVGDEQDYSNCINFKAASFNETAGSASDALERTMHFDPWRRWDGRDDTPVARLLGNPSTSTLPVCEYASAREVLINQNNPTTLKNFINALSARGNTSIDIGMKWGVALLDPAIQPTLQAMSVDGDIPATFSNRPYAYNQSEVLKVVVLMTDGQNTSQYYLHEDFRSGDSDVWYNEINDRYSVYYEGYSAWYWPELGQWADHPHGQDGYGCSGNSINSMSCWNRNYSGETQRLSWGDLWAWTTMRRVVEDLYEPWMNDNAAWNAYYHTPRRHVGSNTKDNRTYDICDAAKEEDIIVFTIGFEAPSRGRTVLRNCASSDAHYFDVEGLEIRDAFASIATSIRKLRLTQ